MVDTINQDTDVTTRDTDLTPAERELIKRIDAMAYRSKQQKDELLKKHTTALRLWRGEHWRDRPNKVKMGKKWTQATVNRILPIIEQQIAMMTDINPTGVFVPQGADDQVYTKGISDLTHWRAKQINMRGRLIRSEKDAKLFGFCSMYVYWDDSIPGAEDVNCRLLDPRELIIDPLLETTTVEDGEFVGIVRKVSLEYLKYRWPEHADKLQADWESGNSDEFVGVTDSDTLDGELGHTPNASIHGTDHDKDFAMAKLISVWYRDYTMETKRVPVPVELLEREGKVRTNLAGQRVWAETGELWYMRDSPYTDVQVPVYPYGRWTMKAGNVILEDQPWGQSLTDDSVSPAAWPIAIGVNIVIPHRWYGMDETDQLSGRQYVVNDMVSAIEDHVNQTNHPKIKAEVTALMDKKQLRNAAGSIIYTKDGRKDAVEWMNPPILGRETFSLLDHADKSMEQSAGIPGQSMGKQSTDRTTATEIMTLDRAGRGRVGMASALLDEFIARVYLLMAQTIQRHYEVGKIVRILGAGRQDVAIQMKQGHKSAMFDVQVQTGATTPYDKETNRRKAVELNNLLGGAYLPEVLDAYDVDNKDEILQRHQAWMLFTQYQQILMLPQVQQILNQVMAQTQVKGQNNDNGKQQQQ